jgi:hypothetical protein
VLVFTTLFVVLEEFGALALSLNIPSVSLPTSLEAWLCAGSSSSRM